MKLLTRVQNPLHKAIVDCKTKVLTIGSCFSGHIGERLEKHHFEVLTNPFGTVFNPVSLAKVLRRGLQSDQISGAEIEEYQDRFFHYDYHTRFDAPNRDMCVTTINKAISEVATFCHGLDVLVLTFGTSIVYQRSTTKEVVSNCHKVPAREFERRFLSLEEMINALEELISAIRILRPNLNVITTVSPVRHTKEGLVDNQRSKSRLISLCQYLEEHHEIVSYFPSYEIMIDELRDYRFFNEDMIHPSNQAVEEIWQRFVASNMTVQAQGKVQRLRKLLISLDHRPFNVSSQENQHRVQKLIKEIEQIESDFSEVDLTQERQSFVARNSI